MAATAKEREYVLELITRVVRECPRRQPTSEDERRASFILRDEFERLGLDTEVQGFEFNDNLYANLALHFGVGSAGTMVSPLIPPLGLALHLLAGTSYWADSTRRAYVLRRLFKFKPSQNVLATLPARSGEPRLRIVLNAHVDAAFTGFLFQEKVVRAFSGDLPESLKFLNRSLEVAAKSQFVLAGFDLARMLLGPLTWPLVPVEHLINLPALLAFILGAEVTIRDEIVPGANDDLSGTAALPVLAARLARSQRGDVELVFVATGCEEASLGGGDALVRDNEHRWKRENTVFLSLDGLTNGALQFLNPEGEVVPTPVPEWLAGVVRRLAASEPRFNQVTDFPVPVGGSDAAAALARGYDAVCLACVDHEIGSPRHYHQASDTPENLDMDGLMLAIDFAEKLVQGIVEHRLGPAPAPAKKAPKKAKKPAKKAKKAKKPRKKAKKPAKKAKKPAGQARASAPDSGASA